MIRELERRLSLQPKNNIRVENGSLIALDAEPWLGVADALAFPRRGFVRLAYAIAPTQAPLRPILRFWFAPNHWRDVVMPAPTDGVGVWIGRAPRNFTEVWINPTDRPGRFSFDLTMRRATVSEVCNRVMSSPKRLFFALGAGLVGLEAEADLNWRWALGREPTSAYRLWREVRQTGLSTTALSFDRPEDRIVFQILLDIEGADRSSIQQSCDSLLRQSYKHWRAAIAGDPLDAPAAKCLAEWMSYPGFRREPGPGDLADPVARLRAGDRLDGEALAAFAEHFTRYPEQDLVYADETQIRADGRLSRSWRPGWSPTLQRSTNYIGRAAFFRRHLLGDNADWRAGSAEDLIDRLALRAASHGKVGRIARPLFIIKSGARRIVRDAEAIYRGSPPSVTVIIPTRDRADLLEDCLESLFGLTSYPNYRVVLIDNDSVEPRTHDLLARLTQAHERLQILRIPGAFNFSALCNAGSNATADEYLLFLNNDTRIVTKDWIERLLYFATKPDIGAVGAKLLYPNRQTQHVGIVLGMGGVAGHFCAGLEEKAPGWMGWSQFPHEVSAVTGACLMVERRKFEAVGRFDEKNLPVDLNDVDLCLRLGERGWRTICHSQVVLIHRQSASRGGGFRLQRVYAGERAYFLDRWRSVVRDDPYFNPGLSLYANEEALP